MQQSIEQEKDCESGFEKMEMVYLTDLSELMVDEKLLVYIVNKRVYAKYMFKDDKDLKLCDGTYKK